MSVEERAKDIKSRLRADMAKTLRQAALPLHVLDDLMEDALHHIEPLLLEVEDVRGTVNDLLAGVVR